MEKIYISADQLLADSFRLAVKIYQQGFRPDFIIGVWRGGAPVGIAVQEYLKYKGETPDHIAIRTSSYYGIDQQSKTVEVHGLEYVIDNLSHDKKLLIVDDVFDTGRSIKAILETLRKQCGDAMPETTSVACPWFKPNKNLTELTPDFYLHETDQWLVFPHEIEGLSIEELRAGKPEIAEIIEHKE